MAIQWNKVTWYSKLLALILFVALPFIGFWYGTQYESALQQAAAPTPASTTVTRGITQATTSDYYANTDPWPVIRHDDAGFTIAYPIDFTLDDSHSLTPTNDWRIGASEAMPGLKVLTITIPSAFEPQTNFGDARLSVGYSVNNNALSQCLAQDASGGPTVATSSVVINGIHFVVFHSSDAGAGNYYETTSYRTLHDGACYAVEYTIHSTQVGNYPPEYGIKQFDKTKAIDVLDGIVGTFKFL